MALPWELATDLTREILLRLPPDDPASLVRASLACRPWCRILFDPAFPRLYGAFHRKPPLLGFFHNRDTDAGLMRARFVPNTAPSPSPQPALDYDHWCVLDCRHGRVLVDTSGGAAASLVVWDPITGHREQLPEPEFPIPRGDNYTAAVLCAAAHGCDHLDCHGGPFLVVLTSFNVTLQRLQAHVYSSEAGGWNASAHVDVHHHAYTTRKPSALIGDCIYSMLMPLDTILRFDLGNNRLSTISVPESYHISGGMALMPMEDGSLGLASVRVSRLFVWSRNVNPMGVEGWIRSRVIELKTHFAIQPYIEPQVAGSAEGFGIIFVTTNTGVFTMDLKSGRVKKVGEPGDYYAVFPFMSFYSL